MEAGERRRGKRLIATAILLLGTQVVIWIVFPIFPPGVPIMGYLVLGVVGLVAIAIDLPITAVWTGAASPIGHPHDALVIISIATRHPTGGDLDPNGHLLRHKWPGYQSHS